MTETTHRALLATLRPSIPAPPAFLLSAVPSVPADRNPSPRPSPTRTAPRRNRSLALAVSL